MSSSTAALPAQTRPRSFFFHLAALALLVGLDRALWLRGWILRRFRFLFLGGFALAACAIAGVSLFSLTRIAGSSRLLIDDAMTGLESTALMRPLVVELQFDVLRQAYVPGQQLTSARVDEFERRFDAALATYRRGAFTAPDQAIGDEIHGLVTAYVDALQPLVDNPFPTKEQLLLADSTMEQLTDEISQGRQFNLGRLRLTAEQARSEADSALEFSYWTWRGFGLVVVLGAALVLMYRWIGAPDKLGGSDPGSLTPWEGGPSASRPAAASRTPFAP